MHHGANLAEVIAHAREIGVEVLCVRRTGEIRFRHSSQPHTIRLNGRRKDASRAATTFVNKVEAAVRSQATGNGHGC